MRSCAVLIDGGNTRALTRQARHDYTPDYIEKLAVNSGDT